MTVSWFSCSFSLSLDDDDDDDGLEWALIHSICDMPERRNRQVERRVKNSRELRCFWESCARCLLLFSFSLSILLFLCLYISLALSSLQLSIHRPEITSSMYRWHLLLCPKALRFSIWCLLHPSAQSKCLFLSFPVSSKFCKEERRDEARGGKRNSGWGGDALLARRRKQK